MRQDLPKASARGPACSPAREARRATTRAAKTCVKALPSECRDRSSSAFRSLPCSALLLLRSVVRYSYHSKMNCSRRSLRNFGSGSFDFADIPFIILGEKLAAEIGARELFDS